MIEEFFYLCLFITWQGEQLKREIFVDYTDESSTSAGSLKLVSIASY